MDAARPVTLEEDSHVGAVGDAATLQGTTLVGRYRVDAPIGRGGMALVYAGRHLALDREVAIKVLRSRYGHKQSVIDRFMQEARAASRARHPHIVEVSDFGSTPSGLVFLVMERLEGETLAELILRDGRLPWARARTIALQLCEALQATHDAGIVHRDISLKNFFLVANARGGDFVKVLDFGIARLAPQDSSDARPLRRLTSDTQIMGTPEFMSPEQATRAGGVDLRSDIYAMGVALYAMLTARMPFEAETAIDMMAKHIYEPVPPPSLHEPTLAPAVETVVLRALEKDPDRRFQSMRELADALASIPEDARAQLPAAPEPALPLPDVVEPLSVPPRRRSLGRRVAALGAFGAMAWWGWQDGDWLIDRASTMMGIEALDRIALPAPVVSKRTGAPREPEIATASIVPIEPPPAAITETPVVTRPPSVPPAPRTGWLDPPKRKRVRPAAAPANAPTAAPIEPAATPEPIAATPVSAALEPELVPDPPTTP
jgi:eukaryotic-like serine/threonine-protein kinase